MSANNTKSRLQSLKEMLDSDAVSLDTNAIIADTSDFPDATAMVKYIDYDEEKKNHKEFAEQSISNIITTYIKSVKLLDSPRLKDLKQTDVLKYSRLLLLVNISEANLIKLQESIDGGDMSPEMYRTVGQAQKELRDNMEAMDKHLDKCEKYWSNYASNYGLENEEEKIVQESEFKDDTKKHTIIDMSKLTELIHKANSEDKEKYKDQK